MRVASAPVPQSVCEVRAQVEAFLENSRRPALLEPGEELLAIAQDNYSLELRSGRLTLQVWDRTRNLTRRVVGIAGSAKGRLELTVVRFARRQGQVFLLDLEARAGMEAGRRGARLVFRERFRLFLRRQFPEWNLAELSTEANLEFSLSPAFPRAFLRHGQHGWAAIACPPEGDATAVLSFGLIWLAYLRSREHRATIEGLAIYVPGGAEYTCALRLPHLDARAARFELFAYSEQDFIVRVDPADRGNIDTRLDPCRRAASRAPGPFERLAALDGVESIPLHDGRISLRVRGIEFAQCSEAGILSGTRGEAVSGPRFTELEALAQQLAQVRSPAADHNHPLYRQSPEAWLESQARAQIEVLDATLLSSPVYGQVPAFAGGARGIIDLLAVDRAGRLAVIELKATQDLHLPMQALDYWIRVKWHLDRGEFTANGYFPGLALRPDPPRLLLASPALDFHPTSETLLGFFSPGIDVERIGLAVEWRKGLQVMFRLAGSERPL